MIIQSRPVETPAPITLNPGYLRAKRFLDIAFTLLLAPLIICIGLIVAICIKLDSKGPVFFRQKRVGQNGIEFEMLKFRSMYRNANQIAHQQNIVKYMNGEMLNADGAESHMAYKATNDPRITRVGRFIRKTSLDEIPQFWNVLRGQMSLVGPRPPLPYEVELYSPHEWLRMVGKPGLTGTWQVYGRSRVTFQNMVKMDLEYLAHQSLWHDIKLILLTIPVIIFARGGA